MSIKGINRNIVGERPSSILDKTLTVKDLLMYLVYGLIALAILFIIVIIPFMIGRASVDCGCSDDTDKSDRVAAATDLINKAAASPQNITSTPSVNETVELVDTTPEVEEEPEEEEEEEVVEEDTYDEDEDYVRTDPRVATKYTDVDIELLDFDHEMRGLDWGTINEVKVMINNDQSQIVIPYSLKIKIYNVGDSASDWWDDEINLRDHLNIIVPDGTKTLTLDTHVSFSEVDEKKKIALYLYDEVGKQMTSRIKEITIEDNS